LQGNNVPANLLIQDIDENEAYADKKCFIRYEATNLKDSYGEYKEETLLNLKDILALQQEDTATAQSFRVSIPNETMMPVVS